MIREVNGKPCPVYEDVINAIRASGETVELTLSRKAVVKLLDTKLHMELGTSTNRVWEEFTFRLFSNRELTFEKVRPLLIVS